MSSSRDDTLNYKDLRQNLPKEPMTPTAPTYDTVSRIEHLPENQEVVNKNEEILRRTDVVASPSLDARKRLRIEAEIKKALLRKEQLMKERQIVEEEFKTKEILLDAELELVLTNLESAEVGPSVINNTSDGVVELGNKTLNNFTAQNQLFQLQKPILKSSNGIETSAETPNPRGLEQLNVLDYVSIRQLKANTIEESYEVVTPGDVVILRANLSFSVVNMPVFGQMKVINVDMFDSELNEVINLRPGALKSKNLYVNGQLASVIRRAPTYYKPMLTIHDPLARPLLKIKGAGIGSDRNVFLVQTTDKLNIGSVDKSPAFVPSGYVSGNHTVLKFPLSLDVRFKATIIASSFLIMNKDTVNLRKKKLQEAILKASAPFITSE